MKAAIRIFLSLAWFAIPITAHAQEAPASPPPADERPTGLPSAVTWTFNLDAAWGNFGFQNSLFTDPKEGVPQNLSDQWFEGFVKPALSGSFKGTKGELYGKLSAVGERTYGAAPPLVGVDVGSFQAEDLYVGWRSGKTLERLGEDALDFSVGRAPFQLGHGFLLYDGASEGGSRGGYWSNARKAFQFAAIGRLKTGKSKLEGFYLDRDELPENDTGSRLWGANYEFSFTEDSSVGVTYLKTMAHADLRPDRDGMNVFDFRGYIAPVPAHKDLTVEAEYAHESNGDLIDSNGWYLQGAYQLSKVAWKPKVSYRYAFFEGDDVTTKKNEAFDPLFLGFNDWGAWWQGEIAGEYFLSNSNLKSRQLRVHTAPTANIGTGLILYNFNLHRPASYAPGVTSGDLAVELDWYMDWKINKNFTASFVAAYADPGKAVQQAFDRTKNFAYGMVYLAYSF